MKKNKKIWIYTLVVIGAFLIFAGSCKKADDSNDNPISKQTVKDIDGNVYHTVTIGTQVWMVENLKTTKYRNGDAIPKMEMSGTTGGQLDYDDDKGNSVKYGKLYNWYAVMDNRNIAPIGWHVATSSEFDKLIRYLEANLGTSGSVSKTLAAKTDWASASGEAGLIGNDLTKNNESGFTALPSGYLSGSNDDYVDRLSGAEFKNIGKATSWWCYLNSNNGVPRISLEVCYKIYYADSEIRRKNEPRLSGFSVRCVKD